MSDEHKTPILVNGEEVGEHLVAQELQLLHERYAREMSPDEMAAKANKVESDARENAVERVLLMQEARRVVADLRVEEVAARFTALQAQHGGADEFEKQFDLSAEDVAQIKAEMEDGLRLEKYFDLICRDVSRPGESDSRSYYGEHAAEFIIPERVHAAHIVQHPSSEKPLEAVYADLLNIRERLLRGEDFGRVAGETSDCQDGGHDLGYFSRGQMVPSFEEVAFSTKTGEISDVFQTEFGYHILTVFNRKPQDVRPYEEVRYDIEGMLFDEWKNDAIGVVVDGLRASAVIENLEVVED